MVIIPDTQGLLTPQYKMRAGDIATTLSFYGCPHYLQE